MAPLPNCRRRGNVCLSLPTFNYWRDTLFTRLHPWLPRCAPTVHWPCAQGADSVYPWLYPTGSLGVYRRYTGRAPTVHWPCAHGTLAVRPRYTGRAPTVHWPCAQGADSVYPWLYPTTPMAPCVCTLGARFERPGYTSSVPIRMCSRRETSGPSSHNLRTRTWVTARNHRRITAPHTRTFNHGTALVALWSADSLCDRCAPTAVQLGVAAALGRYR